MFEPINEVNFAEPHDVANFLHYSRKINGHEIFESYDKSTRSIVYRGPDSYWKRSQPEWYAMRVLRNHPCYKTIVEREQRKQEELDAQEEGVLRKKRD